jgi:lysosomal Pro-X carboxypeptidase
LDIQRANPSTDPDWLVMQREKEVKIIEGWISKYYTDLLEVKDQTPS